MSDIPKEPKEPKGMPDEISVTDVSSEVLEELSTLFGRNDPKPVADNVDNDTTHVQITDPTSEDVVVVVEDESEEVQESDDGSFGVVISFADGEIRSRDSSAPRDPLLRPLSSHGDIVEITDDSGGTVVIDADEVDRVVIVDDDRPDPRFEERRRKMERRDRLRKVKWLKLAGVIVGACVLIAAVLASPLFAIRRVAFEGTVYTSTKTMDAVRNALKGSSVFTANTSKARTVLLADPWVADVRITTDFPGKALVEVSERVPVVWYVGDDLKARIVDARGKVIEVLTGWPTKYLQVRGVGPSLEAGATADDVFRAAAQLVLALPDEIKPRVKALELGAGGELSMILKSGTIIRFGPPTDLQNKLVEVVVLLRRQDPETLAVIDVSTGDPTVSTK